MNYYFTEGHKELKAQKDAAEALFRHALNAGYGITGAGYKKDECGKPYIPNTGLYLSISHSKAGVACIIAEFPVGIDIEEISRFKPEHARKICTPAELALLEEAEDKQDFLCRLWTLKEANFKAFGEFKAPEKHFYSIKRSNTYISIASEKPIEF